jgi:hypothetical protein
LQHEAAERDVREQRGTRQGEHRRRPAEEPVAGHLVDGGRQKAQTTTVPPIRRERLGQCRCRQHADPRANEREHPEQPAPRHHVQEDPTEQWGKHRCQTVDEHQQREDPGDAVVRKRVPDDRPRHDEPGGAAQPLPETCGDERVDAGCERAGDRHDGEPSKADEERAAPTNPVAERADDQLPQGEAPKCGRQRQLGGGVRRPEVESDERQCRQVQVERDRAERRQEAQRQQRRPRPAPDPRSRVTGVHRSRRARRTGSRHRPSAAPDNRAFLPGQRLEPVTARPGRRHAGRARRLRRLTVDVFEHMFDN